jgi:hypothetical protein
MVGLCRAQIRSGARCRLLPARINTLREEAAQSAGHRSIQAITRALLFPFVVLGQEIQPFDRLGRENVTIQYWLFDDSRVIHILAAEKCEQVSQGGSWDEPG